MSNETSTPTSEVRTVDEALRRWPWLRIIADSDWGTNFQLGCSRCGEAVVIRQRMDEVSDLRLLPEDDGSFSQGKPEIEDSRTVASCDCVSEQGGAVTYDIAFRRYV